MRRKDDNIECGEDIPALIKEVVELVRIFMITLLSRNIIEKSGHGHIHMKKPPKH
jgi:hypothetical protein